MNNYPDGAEYENPPWLDKQVAGTYLAHYILTETDGIDTQFEVYLPEQADDYELWKLSKDWAKDNGLKYIDHSKEPFTGCITVEREECYE